VPAIDVGVVVSLFGAIIGCYVVLSKRQDKTEDCVESELKEFKKCLNAFQQVVIDRLARIETKLEAKEK